MKVTTRSTARFVAVLVFVLAALAIAAPLAGARTSAQPHSAARHVSWYRWHGSRDARHLKVKRFHSTVVIGLKRMRDLESLRAVYGFNCVRELPSLRAAVVRVAAPQLRALLADGPTDRRIRYVSALGPTRRPMDMPNDPYVSKINQQTGLAYEWQFIASHVDEALKHSKGDPHIVVGVIDTGVVVVPDLKGKIDSIWTVNPDGSLVQVPLEEGNDQIGHGTAVTSLIVANIDDGFGIAGFGGSTHAIVIKASPPGTDMFDDTALAIALDKLVSLGVRVVNMSLGGVEPSSPILIDAIHRAAAAGVLLVASSGNKGPDVLYPAAALQAEDGARSIGLSVGATNAYGTRADFSKWGRRLSIMAPGDSGLPADVCGGVLVALPPASVFDDDCYLNWLDATGSHYGYMRGTSFASPEVAGIAALILAVRPGLTTWQLADILKQSAIRTWEGWIPQMGCGRLDAGAALELAVSRSDAEWAELAARQTDTSAGDVCSTDGTAAPSWPTVPPPAELAPEPTPSPLDQTITFPRLASKRVGDPNFTIIATASSGLPVSFTAIGKCTVHGAKVHLKGAGTCVIIASQPGDDSYKSAGLVSRSFRIAKAAHGRRT
jgi:subtilisin family serine protease